MKKYISPRIIVCDCIKDVILDSDTTMDNIGNLDDWMYDE